MENGCELGVPEGPLHRVKVYNLDGDGRWADKGTGNATTCYMDSWESGAIVVHNENKNAADKFILRTKLSGDDIYTLQQGG